MGVFCTGQLIHSLAESVPKSSLMTMNNDSALALAVKAVSAIQHRPTNAVISLYVATV